MIGGRVESTNGTAAARHADPQSEFERIKADVRQAYERGRQDERASRRRHPVVMTLLFAAAICGVALLVLAAVNGSFGAGGLVADQALSGAARDAQPRIRDAASQAGRSLRDAGEATKAKTTGSAS